LAIAFVADREVEFGLWLAVELEDFPAVIVPVIPLVHVDMPLAVRARMARRMAW
jgi:hypothetical protein